MWDPASGAARLGLQFGPMELRPFVFPGQLWVRGMLKEHKTNHKQHTVGDKPHVQSSGFLFRWAQSRPRLESAASQMGSQRTQRGKGGKTTKGSRSDSKGDQGTNEQTKTKPVRSKKKTNKRMGLGGPRIVSTTSFGSAPPPPFFWFTAMGRVSPSEHAC